jgi:predicted dehydrogenase
MGRARIGVIGAGWWSTQHHIPSLRTYEKAELVGIADPNPDKLNAAASFYEVEGTFQDYRDLLPKVDGVVIAVPHVYHYEIARDALDAGVHVLVEKPMVLTATHAWDLVRRAEEKGVELMVGTTFQFTSQAHRVREIVQSGAIGDLLHVSGLFASMVESFLRSRPHDYRVMFEYPVTGPDLNSYSDPKIAGGGQGQTQLSHAMGMVFWVTGRHAIETFAYMENFDLQVDLVDAISYRLDNGAVGTMGATGSVGMNQDQNQEFRYYGTKGQLRQDMIHGKADAIFNDGTSEVLPDLAEDDIYPADLTARTLADLTLGQGENLAPGRVAARTVELLEAAYKSAESGLPVKIAESGGGT